MIMAHRAIPERRLAEPQRCPGAKIANRLTIGEGNPGVATMGGE
jgi:hypothetical protein